MALKALTGERAAFCSHCEGPVEPSAPSCRSCGQSFDGVLDAQRCPACGALADEAAGSCARCRRALDHGASPRGELEQRLQSSLDSMNGVLEDQRARLGDLERRLEKTRSRLEAVKDSTKEVEVKERARLNVWMGQAEDERGAILRVAEGWMEVSEAFAAVRGRLRELEGQLGQPPPAQAMAEQMPSEGKTPQVREANLKQWWEAQKGIQQQLIKLAKGPEGTAVAASPEANPEGQPEASPEREAVAEVLEEIRKVFDELPPGLQKKLRKSGRFEELEALLSGKGK